MRFRNPWIDPRVARVKPADAEAYLLNHGWIRVDCEHPNKHAFASSAGEQASVVCVAQRDQADDFSQRIIELIADLSRIEGRYAGDVLTDILQSKVARTGGNGSPATTDAERAI